MSPAPVCSTRCAPRSSFIATPDERDQPPWHASLRTRQVKAPKVCVRDTGLLHELLGIENHSALLLRSDEGARRIRRQTAEIARVD